MKSILKLRDMKEQRSQLTPGRGVHPEGYYEHIMRVWPVFVWFKFVLVLFDTHMMCVGDVVCALEGQVQ